VKYINFLQNYVTHFIIRILTFVCNKKAFSHTKYLVVDLRAKREEGVSLVFVFIKFKNMNEQIKWSVDQAHTEVGFKVKHLMIANVKGSFKTFEGSIYTKGRDFTTAEIDFWIDPSSVETGDSKRDEHLKGIDFFDVEHHKEITFVASTIGKANYDGIQDLWGELTMVGITKNVKLAVEFGGIIKDPWTNEKAGFTITGKIKRSDWGLVWNATIEAGGVLVSDDITILCELELTNIGFKDLKMELENDKNEVLDTM
jgi:polyisoprenoid-binding protein YceI